jgi:hypothetical protein
MKLLSLFVCVLSLNTFASACPDISGKFQGRCTETFYTHPEANKNPELLFNITQTQCNTVEVKMTHVSSGAEITDTFDVTVDKMKMLETDKMTLYSSAMYTEDALLGSIEHISKMTGINVMYFSNRYSTVDVAGVPHLVFSQGSTNYLLECEIPAAN